MCWHVGPLSRNIFNSRRSAARQKPSHFVMINTRTAGGGFLQFITQAVEWSCGQDRWILRADLWGWGLPPAPVYKYLVTSLLTVLSSGIMHLAFTGGAGQSVWLAANSALMSASCLQPAPHGSQQPLQASLLTQLCLIPPLPPPPPATHPGRTHGCWSWKPPPRLGCGTQGSLWAELASTAQHSTTSLQNLCSIWCKGVSGVRCQLDKSVWHHRNCSVHSAAIVSESLPWAPVSVDISTAPVSVDISRVVDVSPALG